MTCLQFRAFVPSWSCIYKTSHLFSHLYQVGMCILSRISYGITCMQFYVYSLAPVSNLVLLYLMDKTSVRMSRLCVCKLVFCTEWMRIFFDEPAVVIDVLEFWFFCT